MEQIKYIHKMFGPGGCSEDFAAVWCLTWILPWDQRQWQQPVMPRTSPGDKKRLQRSQRYGDKKKKILTKGKLAAKCERWNGALLRENFSENRHTPRPQLRILRIIGISFVVVTGTSTVTWARHVARMHEKPKAYDKKKKEDWYIWACKRSKQISSIRISVPRLELVGRLPAGSRSCSSQL